MAKKILIALVVVVFTLQIIVTASQGTPPQRENLLHLQTTVNPAMKLVSIAIIAQAASAICECSINCGPSCNECHSNCTKNLFPQVQLAGNTKEGGPKSP
ncbi:hypothetical protein CASFOL_025747 [Castilleja foliolosa]|uniref:Uncharacterized protein n=1 Tax=Castilleja foliolosa TaxID=1961234 RepID=A0ABD3CSV4_9LAMI